jgi:2,3-bisphosphoglycerate-dependent phosphoglycerate mutase
MQILLVRHGQSASNVDKSVNKQLADHAVPLSEKGHRQALEAGKFLAGYLTTLAEHKFSPFSIVSNIYIASGKVPGRLWVSPYLRTRQTADEIETAVKEECSAVFESGRREHINLAEQQFGLFDGLHDEELAAKYPNEHEHYKKCEDQAGRFWARMPLGESRFDVAVRVHEAFGTFKRDEEKHHINIIIVVCHGATIRAFVMQWLHLPFEWFENEPNPTNCSIRLIEDDMDKGYIFKGFPKD